MIFQKGSGAEKKQSLLQWIDKQEDKAPQHLKITRYLLRLLLIIIQQFNSNELSLRSGALTYTILLSLVPMMAMSTAVVKGLGGGDQLRQAAYTYLETLENSNPPKSATEVIDQKEDASVAPEGENLTSHLRSAVDKLFDYVDRTNFATLGTFGVLGILLSVILVLSHIESAMNAIWKVTSGRSPLRKLADYLTLLILFPLSINVAFAASAFLTSPKLSEKMDLFIPFDWIQTLLLQAVPVFFIALTFYAIYIFFPNTKVKTIPAVIGATLAAILWFGIQNIYITLQVGVARYNAIYGSFATLPLFLVWMYLGWMFILTGAQVAYAFQNATSYRLTPLKALPSLRLSTAFDIMDLIYRYFDRSAPLTSGTLISSLPAYPPRLVEEIIQDLLEAKVIHQATPNGHFYPQSPKGSYKPNTIVEIIIGKDSPDTTGGEMSKAAIRASVDYLKIR